MLRLWSQNTTLTAGSSSEHSDLYQVLGHQAKEGFNGLLSQNRSEFGYTPGEPGGSAVSFTMFQEGTMNNQSTLHNTGKLCGGLPVFARNRTDEVKTGSPHWYISFNNVDRRSHGGITTALVLGQMEYFLILLGDHRENFQACINSQDLSTTALARCLNYVRDNRDSLAKTSDPLV